MHQSDEVACNNLCMSGIHSRHMKDLQKIYHNLMKYQTCLCLHMTYYLRAAIAADPNMYEAYNNLGGQLIQVNNYTCQC